MRGCVGGVASSQTRTTVGLEEGAVSGMYNPFVNRDPWERLADYLEMHLYMCLGAMEEAMRDPSLDDEWPEWAVG